MNHLRAWRKSTLVMNALYLMLSTFVVAAAGFGFWVVVTRSYDTAAVGLATTLLSASGLLSLLSLAGFDTTFVRFLPGSNRKNAYINTGVVIVASISLVLAVLVALALPRILPSLSLLANPWAFLSFVFFTVVTSLNTLTNAVFLGFKQARYIFMINVLFSAFKVVAPLLIVRGDALTIFTIAGCAQLIGLVLSFMWMRRRFAYSFSPRLDVKALRLARTFSSSVYASSVLNLLPPTLLPLIIVFYLNPSAAAYYYMAFTIASVLYTIAYAVTQSVFAEGSHDEAALKAHVTKAAQFIAVVLVPCTLGTVVLSGLLLNIFGQDYARAASPLLQLFALSALPVAAYSALGAIFKVSKNLRGVVSMNIGYAVAILGLSLGLVPHFGLIAVGWAWLLGNLTACGIGFWFLINARNKQLGV